MNTASQIFADMTTGWDTTCGGGIWWNKTRTYKNAIANAAIQTSALDCLLAAAEVSKRNSSPHEVRP